MPLFPTRILAGKAWQRSLPSQAQTITQNPGVVAASEKRARRPVLIHRSDCQPALLLRPVCCMAQMVGMLDALTLPLWMTCPTCLLG